MKKIHKKMCLSVLLYFMWASVSNGQSYLDRKGIIEAQIDTLIHARFGREFICEGYSMLDSLIHYSEIEKDYRIQDPYGTLKGCILFSACKNSEESYPDTFIAGMVKNGRIIWDNAPGTRADIGGQLLYAQDINNDGEVDLIIAETDTKILRIGKGPLSYYLYVLSWDGKKGTFINAFRRDGKSVILSDGGCALVAGKQKSIQDIMANVPDVYTVPKSYRTKAYPSVTYKWNGSEYGFWPDEKEKEKK